MAERASPQLGLKNVAIKTQRQSERQEKVQNVMATAKPAAISASTNMTTAPKGSAPTQESIGGGNGRADAEAAV
jgi:hypothetical protein